MSNEIPSGGPGEAQKKYAETEIDEAIKFRQIPEGDAVEAGEDASVRVQHAREFLDNQPRYFNSDEEFLEAYKKVMQELDVAILISNEPQAHDVRARLIQKFGVLPE